MPKSHFSNGPVVVAGHSVSSLPQRSMEIEWLMSLAPPRSILDVGCGNGRHAIEFARREYEV